MKLLPQPLDFFANYPLKYYARALITPKPSFDATFMVGMRTTAVLLTNRRTGNSTYGENLESKQGAPTAEALDPNQGEVGSFCVDGEYHKKVNKAFGLGRGAYGALIFETAKIHDNLHSLKGGPKTVKEMIALLKSDEIRNVLPSWSASEPYEWAVFTRKLELLPLTSDPSEYTSLFLVGIPESAADFYCEWANETGFILTAAVPLSFAVGGWAMNKLTVKESSFFLVIPGQDKHRAFFVANGEVKAFLHAPNQQFVEQEMTTMIEDTILENPDCSNAPCYIWLSESVDIRQVVNRFQTSHLKNMQLLDKAFMKHVYEREEEISPSAIICDWVAGMANPGHVPMNGVPATLILGEGE